MEKKVLQFGESIILEIKDQPFGLTQILPGIKAGTWINDFALIGCEKTIRGLNLASEHMLILFIDFSELEEPINSISIDPSSRVFFYNFIGDISDFTSIAGVGEYRSKFTKCLFLGSRNPVFDEIMSRISINEDFWLLNGSWVFEELDFGNLFRNYQTSFSGIWKMCPSDHKSKISEKIGIEETVVDKLLSTREILL
jgi:hypothetical protein